MRTAPLRSLETLQDDGSIGAAVALIWTVHPLNSEAVDYVTQRTESLMALCYLLTLYGSIRAIRSKRPQRWQLLAVAHAPPERLKEVIATAPLMVVLYDRVFVFSSIREAFKRRGRFYGALVGAGCSSQPSSSPAARRSHQASAQRASTRTTCLTRRRW